MSYRDLESERCIISSMLNSEESLIECCASLGAEDFTDRCHMIIFDTLSNLYRKAKKVTYLEVLKEAKTLTKEDREYLKQTIGYHVSTAQLPFWLEKVKERSNRRKLRSTLIGIAEDLKDESIPTEELLNTTQKKIMDITTNIVDTVDTGKDLSEFAKQVIRERMEKKGELQGIPSGIKKLDRLTGGWKLEDFIMVAAETGKGKTAFAQNFIFQGCFMHEDPTLYINSEMSTTQVVLRFSSMLSRVNADRIRFGEIEQHELKAIESNLNLMEYAPFYHYPKPDLSLNKVVGMIRKYHVQKGVKFVIVDYVGRMNKLDKELKEWQVLEQICKTLKTLAQELKIAVLVLAQLNDDGSLQAAKRMENESDIFIKLQPMSQDDITEAKTKGYRNIPNYWMNLVKNREGQSEIKLPVLFKKETLQVVDVYE